MDNKKAIIIFGCNEFAQLMATYISESGIEVVGFMVDDEYYTEETFCSKKVYKTSNLNDNKVLFEYDFLLCIGYKSMRIRKVLFDKLYNLGVNFTNYIHPSVILPSQYTIGNNNIIFPGVVIENNAEIGNNNVIWSMSLVAHDSKIGNHNYLSAKVLFGGKCIMKDLCFLGNATFMIDSLLIEDETYLISGSGLFTNTEISTKYMGIPARRIGTHEKTGIEI